MCAVARVLRAVGRHRLHHLLDHQAAVTHDRHVGPAHLAELSGIDVDMDHLRAGCERVDLARHAVVEPRTESDEQIRLLHRGHRGVVAVHARHPETQLVVVWERTARHERRHHREAGQLRQCSERLGRSSLEDAATGIDHRPVRLGHQPRRVLHLLGVTLHVRLVAREVDAVRPVPVHLLVRHVLGQVDEHRSRTPGRRHVEGLAHDARDLARVGHEPVVLRDRHRDADRVALLERVGADHRVRHLPGDHHDRDRIHVGVAQRRHDVGGSRAARDHRHAGTTGRVRVSLGHVAGALLVTHEDVADRRVDQRVVDGQDRPAGQAEHDFDRLVLEALDEGLGSGDLHRCSVFRRVACMGWMRKLARDMKRPPLRRGADERTRAWRRACAT